MAKKRLTLLEGFGVKDTFKEAKKIADRISPQMEKKGDGPQNKKSSKNEPPIELVNEPPSEPVSERLSHVVTGQLSGHVNHQVTERATELPSELVNKLLTDRPCELPKESDVNYNDPIFWMNDNYAKILTFLIQRKDRIGNTPTIVKSTRVSTATVKRAVSKLEQYGFLRKDKKPYNKGKVRGFVYTINESLCNSFMERRGNSLLCELLPDPLGVLPSERPNELLNERASDCATVPIYSSSSLLNKATTGKIETILSTHPELGYWRQKGLTVKQVEQWMKVADCSLENMIQYLCYCRFEMVDLDLEESKPVDNVFNWFFRILEKAGSYPKPKRYKSHKEKQLEAERVLVEQKEKEAQEAQELYRRKIKAEQDKAFWDMMNDPEGDLYLQCFESLNAFQKKRTTGKGFEMAMRTALT